MGSQWVGHSWVTKHIPEYAIYCVCVCIIVYKVSLICIPILQMGIKRFKENYLIQVGRWTGICTPNLAISKGCSYTIWHFCLVLQVLDTQSRHRPQGAGWPSATLYRSCELHFLGFYLWAPCIWLCRINWSCTLVFLYVKNGLLLDYGNSLRADIFITFSANPLDPKQCWKQ